MAALPRDARGFLIPAETPWEDDVSHLSRYDMLRTIALGAARACAVCGLPLLEGQPVWRLFTQRDAALARIDGDFTDDLSAPGHESCMLYSTLVCPFWRTPQSRLGKESLRAPGAKRGTKPAMLGYEEAYFLVQPRKNLLTTVPPAFRFLYAGRQSDVRFTDAATELGALYATR